MPPRAKQNARRTRARTIAELEEFTQTLETALDGLRVAHAAVGVGEQPAQQPTPTDIEISNQRAAELTAARAKIARLQAEVAAARAEITRLQAVTKGKGMGAVGKGLTITRAGRGVRMTGEAGHRLSLAMDDLSTLLMPGDILQNDDQIAAGHPGVEYLGNEGKGKGKSSPQPFTGPGNRLGE